MQITLDETEIWALKGSIKSDIVWLDHAIKSADADFDCKERWINQIDALQRIEKKLEGKRYE